MLSVIVFMLLVADTTPATSEAIPLVTVYFSISMLNIVIIIILLCYFNRLYHKEKGDGPMGYWTRRYVKGLISPCLSINAVEKILFWLPRANN